MGPLRLVFIFTAFAAVFVAGGVGASNATKKTVHVERVISPGGIEAWLVSDRTNPIIAVQFAFRGGASLDPSGKEGLARMAASLLDEGAGDLDSQAFQRRLEDDAITLRFSTRRDTFTGQVGTLTENRAEAFDLLRLSLTAPRFDTEPVGRIRSQLLANLRSELEDPDVVAGLAMSAALFPGHPYGRPVDGTRESIEAITSGDLKDFFKERLALDNLVIGVVGDIGAAELGRQLDMTFDGLPKKAKPYKIDDVMPRVSGATSVIRMDVPQSAIVFAQAGVSRDHPDFFPAYVLNHILGGGGFTSRLYDQIREKRGLAYSIGSYLYPLDHSALILGSAGTANKSTGETLKVLKEEWQKMAEKGTTQEELNDAKTYLTGSYPLRFTSSDRIASILVAMQLDDLGIDYLDRRNGYIEAVTLEAVNELAGHLIDVDKLTVVVVGKPAGVVSLP